MPLERLNQALKGKDRPYELRYTRLSGRRWAAFPPGVAVVTARGASTQPMGITVNSFTSVSLEPPLVLWCMDSKSDRYQTFTKAKGYRHQRAGHGA